MSVEGLKSFDPELLLQELRARESREADEKELWEAFPRGRVPDAKVSTGGVVETIPELESYDTEDIAAALRGQQKVIYGTDDRVDMYQVTDRRILTDADTVVALVDASDITDNGDGTSTLNGPTFGVARNLCQREPFRDQPTVPFCSGFLVDPSIVATAAHCVNQGNLSSIRFVFGFEMSDAVSAEIGEADYVRLSILGALKLYLDFINMFLFLLRIFGRRR